MPATKTKTEEKKTATKTSAKTSTTSTKTDTKTSTKTDTKTAPKKKTAKKMDYYPGTGRRKTAVAQVRIYPKGKGEYTINGRKLEEQFPTSVLQEIIKSPLQLVLYFGAISFNIFSTASRVYKYLSRNLRAVNSSALYALVINFSTIGRIVFALASVVVIES